jgi:hypothetical protein
VSIEINRVALDLGFDNPEEFIAYAVIAIGCCAAVGMMLFLMFRKK